MKIASWNVNSIKARLVHVLDWLDNTQIDVLCMQEIKTVDAAFPRAEFEQRGYHVATSGQPTYNGVAIVSRRPLADTGIGFVEDTDGGQRRLLEAHIDGVRFINVYVPNGQAVDSPKFAYKLDWMKRLREWLDATAQPGEPLVLCGDFNVAPEARDVWSVEALNGQVLFTEAERAALRNVAAFGLLDSFRLFETAAGLLLVGLSHAGVSTETRPAHRSAMDHANSCRALSRRLDRRRAAAAGESVGPHAGLPRIRLRRSGAGDLQRLLQQPSKARVLHGAYP